MKCPQLHVGSSAQGTKGVKAVPTSIRGMGRAEPCTMTSESQ